MANEKRLIDANALLEKMQFRLPINDKTSEVIAECVDIAVRIIKNAPTVDVAEMKWIPVSERLPEEMEKVMAFVNGVRITAVLKGGAWLSSWNHDVVNDEVTHWCCLPQPPKGE